MRYQIYAMTNTFKKQIMKWVFIYLIFFFIYYIIIFSVGSELFDPNNIESLLIGNLNASNFILILLTIFQYLITIYSSYLIFSYDYNNSPEYISLRINGKKRFFYKIVVSLLFCLILRTVYYFIIFILYKNYFNFYFNLYFCTIYTHFIISFITCIITYFRMENNIICKFKK